MLFSLRPLPPFDAAAFFRFAITLATPMRFCRHYITIFIDDAAIDTDFSSLMSP